jgi:hypothetical protein
LLTFCGCRQGAFVGTTWRRFYSVLPHCYHYCTCSKAKYLRVVAAGSRKTCARVPSSTKKTTETQVLTFSFRFTEFRKPLNNMNCTILAVKVTMYSLVWLFMFECI